MAALRETIIAFFEAAMVEDQFVLPYAKQGLLGDVYANARVLSEDYDSTGRIMKVRGLPGAIAPAKNPRRFVSSIADRSASAVRRQSALFVVTSSRRKCLFTKLGRGRKLNLS